MVFLSLLAVSELLGFHFGLWQRHAGIEGIVVWESDFSVLFPVLQILSVPV